MLASPGLTYFGGANLTSNRGRTAEEDSINTLGIKRHLDNTLVQSIDLVGVLEDCTEISIIQPVACHAKPTCQSKQ